MKPFMDEDFLLQSDTARFLYHDVAKDMPIFDYHCHLPPVEIAENTQYRNIGHLMMNDDHYKWRAMTTFGLDARVVRGEGDDHEKFLAYAAMIPHAIGNPLYHWTHLELRRVFGIDDLLSPDTAEDIWSRANEMLAQEDFRARGLIRRFGVKVLCTTDDPVDSLAPHKQIAADPSFDVRVLPAFRPDKALKIENEGFPAYIAQLSEAAEQPIDGLGDLLDALEKRISYFHAVGARISDHALDEVVCGAYDVKAAERALHAAMQGKPVDKKLRVAYKTVLLTELGAMYAARGWAQQYHMNALRNGRTAMFERYGADTGFDAISDAPVAQKLVKLLNEQDKSGRLPKTVLYSLNPSANYALATVAGAFNDGSHPGKVQFGSGWWFNDQRDGMVDQMRTLSATGLLSTFVGMVTDSRSFTSYPRHEYFRRILCNLIGSWVEAGEYPNDRAMLARIVRGVCYENAVAYFGIQP